MINTLLWPLEDYDCMKFKSLKFKSSTCNEIIIHPKHLMRFVGHGYWMDPQFGFSAGLFVLRWLGLWKSSPTASLRTEDTVNFFALPRRLHWPKKMLKRAKSQQTRSGLLSQYQSFTDKKKAKNWVRMYLLSAKSANFSILYISYMELFDQFDYLAQVSHRASKMAPTSMKILFSYPQHLFSEFVSI